MAFFSIALAGWLASGLCGLYLLALLRVEGAPVSAGMGSFAGPVTLLAMAQQHSRGQVSADMLPARRQMARAFVGGGAFPRALAGPFAGIFRTSLPMNPVRHVTATLPWITLAAVFSLLVFLVPRKEAIEPPGQWHRWCEALAPGTAPAWGAPGGLALAAWAGCAFAALFWFSQGTPLMLTGQMCRPRAYLRVGPTYMALINPSAWWLAAAVLALAAVNLLMMRGRRAAAEEAQEAAAGSPA